MTRIHLLFYSLAKMYMFMQFAFDDINTFKHVTNLPSLKLAIPWQWERGLISGYEST